MRYHGISVSPAKQTIINAEYEEIIQFPVTPEGTSKTLPRLASGIFAISDMHLTFVHQSTLKSNAI